MVAAAIDAGAVVAFVAIGRRSHDEGSSIGGALRVAGPFLLALALAWLLARAWRAPFALRTGVVVWVVTVTAGMALRRAVFDRGIAWAFVVVATSFLGLLLVGWRAMAARSRHPRAGLAAKSVQ